MVVQLHSCWNAYGMARLGDGEHATISLAARNRTESTSRGYDRDCSTLRELYKSQGKEFGHLVDKWRPQILIMDNTDGRLSINRSVHLSNQRPSQQAALENWIVHFKRIFPKWENTSELANFMRNDVTELLVKKKLGAMIELFRKGIEDFAAFESTIRSDASELLTLLGYLHPNEQRSVLEILPLPSPVMPLPSTAPLPTLQQTGVQGKSTGASRYS
eukprot:TRINITY_DN2435_c0_g1_i2.p1 TRINITY_DN2435_c0_g1~~TRINITY_DN2435_c0_g1_i2.p1  ORF type:complete len:217 (-),score=41.65 TRINITY_DN2435_c0_g1_i2:292-942(-)